MRRERRRRARGAPAARRRERQLAAAQRERLEHPRQPEVVVGVEVREEDLVEVDEPDRRAQQLALRPLAAVEEQPLAAAADEQRARRALRGRRARRGAEEDDVEVHRAAIVAPARGASGARSWALRQHEHLPGSDRRRRQVVRVLDLPDAVARASPA